MTRVKCFFIEPTGRTNLYLRCFRYETTHPPDHKQKFPCPGHGYHDASVFVMQAEEKKNKDGIVDSVDPTIFDNDERWPQKCAHCDYHFRVEDPDDHMQVFQDSVFRRVDTGEEKGLRDWHKVPGAMWDADWLKGFPDHTGPDGRALYVVLPGPDAHHWGIDGRASNCDSPCAHCGRPYHEHKGMDWHSEHCPQRYKDAKPHKCWCRHGNIPELTVDKSCATCGAGGGSILVTGFHGFLRGGWLEEC